MEAPTFIVEWYHERHLSSCSCFLHRLTHDIAYWLDLSLFNTAKRRMNLAQPCELFRIYNVTSEFLRSENPAEYRSDHTRYIRPKDGSGMPMNEPMFSRVYLWTFITIGVASERHQPIVHPAPNEHCGLNLVRLRNIRIFWRNSATGWPTPGGEVTVLLGKVP